jgi:hypothetical protein
MSRFPKKHIEIDGAKYEVDYRHGQSVTYRGIYDLLDIEPQGFLPDGTGWSGNRLVFGLHRLPAEERICPAWPSLKDWERQYRRALQAADRETKKMPEYKAYLKARELGVHSMFIGEDLAAARQRSGLERPADPEEYESWARGAREYARRLRGDRIDTQEEAPR